MTMPDDAFEWQEYGLITPPEPELPPPHTLFQLGLPTITKELTGVEDWVITISLDVTLLGAIDDTAFQVALTYRDLRIGPTVLSGFPDGTDLFTFLDPPGGGSGVFTVDVPVDASTYGDIDDHELIGVQIRHQLQGPAFTDGVAPVGSVGLTVPANGWFYFGEKVADIAGDTDEPYALAGDEEPPYLGWARHDARSAALRSIGVTYGARDSVTRPTPLQATVELAIAVAGDCPPAGQRFRLALSTAAAEALDLVDVALFTGEVTDPTIDPTRGLHGITAAGTLGRKYRRTLAALGWPAESETSRATRIMTAAEITVGTVHAGTTPLAAPQNDDTAGALLDRVTGSTGGAVVEQPDGTVDYLGPDHRRGAALVLTLAPSQVDGRLTWVQHVDDILNEVEVAYAGGTILARDPASIAEREVYPGRVGTDLVSASDAHSLGQLIVARRAEPVWQLPDLEVDLMHMVDDTLRGQLLTLRHGDLIEITDIPAPHAYTGDVKLYVEGWSLDLTKLAKDHPWRWKWTLYVSDRTLSGVSIRWMDVDEGLAWQDVDPTITWLDVARIIDDEQLLGEPDSAPDLIDAGGPGDTYDGVTLDGGGPGDTYDTTYDGGTP